MVTAMSPCAVWIGVELLCLAAAIWLIARADRVRLAPIAVVAATLALVSWGPVALAPVDYWSMAVAAVALAAVMLAIRRTRLGKAARAISGERSVEPVSATMISPGNPVRARPS